MKALPYIKKPEILQFYNHTKGGVDLIDQQRNEYTVARPTNRWPLKIFFNILDIAGINAFTVLQKNKLENEAIKQRRNFIKKLSKALVFDHVKRRLKIQQTPFELEQKIIQVFDIGDLEVSSD